MIDFEIEDAIVAGAVVLGGILTCGVIYLVIGLARYVWGLI